MVTFEQYLARKRMPSLDGLRAVSILLVVIWHTSPGRFGWLSGYLGVPIFFVISGYLITTLLLREEASTGRVSLRGFYTRRGYRILPVYLLVFGAYIAIFAVHDFGGHRQLFDAAAPWYASFMNDFAPLKPSTPFSQSWSLGVEEKFYLAWPILMFAVWRLPRARYLVAATAATLPLLLEPLHVAHWFTAYGQIMVGCLLAFTLNSSRGYQLLRRLNRAAWPLLAVTVALTLLAHPFAMPANLAYPFAAAAVTCSVVTGDNGVAWLLGSRPARWVGERSYGMYLIHSLCLSATFALLRREGAPFVGDNASSFPWALVAAGCGLALTMLAAAVVFRLFEQPIRSYGRRRVAADTRLEPTPQPAAG